jgi:hypothetical protein
MHPTHIAGVGAHGTTIGGFAATAVMVGLCLIGVLVVVIVVLIERRSDRRDGTDGEWGSGGGGRGPHGGKPDGPQPTGDAPEWWPEFERQFAEHVTSTIQTHSQAAPTS